MKQIYYMGVDISKEKVDNAVINNEYKILKEKVVKNDRAKLIIFLTKLLKALKIEKDQLIICCEETGIYKRPLQQACNELGMTLWVEMALKIKKASSALRGKSDKQDALRIAEYACRYSDKMIVYKEPRKENKDLQTLLNVRETILDQITRFTNQLNESKRFDPEKYQLLKLNFKKPISVLRKQLIEVNEQIDALLENCQDYQKNVELLKTIPGIGLQNAMQFIVHTRNFTTFESAKHLACYAGVAPFPNESGMIIKKARVSSLANKDLKRLLHLAAMAAVKTKSELRTHYIRKVKEGKNKMLVLNNVRNKLVKRIFAVVKRQTPYVSINFETEACFLS